MAYRIQINKWKGDEMDETPVIFDTLEQAEAAVWEHFGDVEWADTQIGFQVWRGDIDFDMLFARGGPELWEISMIDEAGQIEEWSDALLNGEEE